VHVTPACAGSEKGSDHFGSYVHSIFLHFCKRLFSGLERVSKLKDLEAAPSVQIINVFLDFGLCTGPFYRCCTHLINQLGKFSRTTLKKDVFFLLVKVRTRKLEQVLCGHVLEDVKRLEQEKSDWFKITLMYFRKNCQVCRQITI
jgi:hypothetical protein